MADPSAFRDEALEDAARRVRLRKVLLPHVSPAATENITLGVRKKRSTQSAGNRMRKHKREELAAAWKKTTYFEKLVLLLLAEHKTLSAPQFKAFFALPAAGGRLACDGWLAGMEEKYGVLLPPDRIFTAHSQNVVYNKVENLKKKGLIDSIKNVANNLVIDRDLAPSLLSVHYFLTELGAQVLVAATSVPLAEQGHPGISFVANYETYAFESLMHLSEVNDFFVSTIAAAQDLMTQHPEEAGILDVTAWVDESETVHKFEPYTGNLVTFRADGMMVFFSSLRSEFVDFYLEHDTGRLPETKIISKTAAFLDFVLYRKATQAEDETFRRPLLLYVTTSESRIATYRKNIHKAVLQGFPQQVDYINAFGRIAVTSVEQIKQHSPLGEVWQVMDLRTGALSQERFNLLTVSW